MTTGRFTYAPARPVPTKSPRRLLRALRVLVIAFVLVTVGMACGLWLAATDHDELVRAFRAGYEAAGESVCRPALQMPIGGRT